MLSFISFISAKIVYIVASVQWRSLSLSLSLSLYGGSSARHYWSPSPSSSEGSGDAAREAALSLDLLGALGATIGLAFAAGDAKALSADDGAGALASLTGGVVLFLVLDSSRFVLLASCFAVSDLLM